MGVPSILPPPPVVATGKAANDNGRRGKPDRWAILIRKWSDAGFTDLAVMARRFRMDGWDFDEFVLHLERRHEWLLSEGR